MATAPTSALSILVADDEQGILDLVQHWLRNAGHAVTCVSNGEQAARMLKVQRFHLVITDIVMPDVDGFELIGMFKKLQPGTPIVAISGGSKYLQGADCLKMARGLGAHAAVMKPFNWEQLRSGIESVLPVLANARK